MGISPSWETSWRISSIGKSGARWSGPTGWPVPGWSTGCGGLGMSAWMLYQRSGIADSGRVNFVSVIAVRIIRSLRGREDCSRRGADLRQRASEALDGLLELRVGEVRRGAHAQV